MAMKSSPATQDIHACEGHDAPDLKPFSITHIRKSHPSHMLIDIIRACDETDAARRAGEHFPDSTVLRICQARANVDAHLAETKNRETHSGGNPMASTYSEPPNARFIRGRFRLAGADDEPALRTICD